LRRLPLHERKSLLKKIIGDTAVQFSESFEVDGPEMYAHACKVGLEGVVSKVRDGCYFSGRSTSVRSDDLSGLDVDKDILLAILPPFHFLRVSS
jgi:hypothetical protein